MRIATVYDFPSFDTGQVAGVAFRMDQGRAELAVHVEGMEDFVLSFGRLRWHEYTAQYNCTPEQIKTAHLKLVEIEGSERLALYIVSDQASAKAYRELHHYRVFVPEHGCHELFAEAVSISRRQSKSAHAGA